MSTNQDPGDLDIVLVELQIGKLHSWLVDRKHIKLSSISATPAFESRRQAAIAAALKEIGSEDTKRGELGEIGELGELGEIGEIGDYWDAFELVQELQRQFPDEEQRKPAAAALATAANAIGQLMMQLTSSSPACSSSQPKHLFVNKTLAELWDVVCVWWVDKGLHFAETAAVLARNALFEIPALKRQSQKLKITARDLHQKIHECSTSLASHSYAFEAKCKEFQIVYNHHDNLTTSTPNFFSSQLIALAVSELPAFFASLQEKIFKNQLILDAINYYRDFSTQHLIKGSGRDTNEDRPRLLSTLEHMFLHGNAPANTLLHQDIDFALGGVGCCNNQKVPDTTTTTTTLSDNIIISVESSGDKKSLSNSLLGNPETRAMLMDDLLELYTFLSSRSSLLESPPVAPIHVQVLTNERTLAEIEEYIKIIDPIILTLESSPTSTSFSSSSNTGNNNNNNKFNNRNNLLLMLLGSPTFSQRLAAQFTTELDAMSKLRKRELELQVRVSDQLTKLKEIEESLNVKVKQTVRLVEKMEEALAVLYPGKRIKIVTEF